MAVFQQTLHVFEKNLQHLLCMDDECRQQYNSPPLQREEMVTY